MSGALQAVFQNQRSFGSPPGQQAYTTAGTYSWVAPTGVTSVSAVAIGGGGPGANALTGAVYCPCIGKTEYASYGGGGGGGGGLAYANNISVTPGNSYTVTVQPGNTSGMPNTSFACFVAASSGSPGNCFYAGNGGTATIGTGFTGGNGGNSSVSSTYTTYPAITGGGGGGAAGYASIGGNGGNYTGASGQTKTGGAGGGGGGSIPNNGGAGGGGSNVYGTLSPYCDTAGTGGGANIGGGGVYGGANASNSSSSGASAGANIGGGGGGGSVAAGGSKKPGASGGCGAVRIIWPGTTRAYPSTCTNDV